jgi:hypothetical protein
MNIISEFHRVRDIPYRIPLTPDAPDHCCSGKTVELMKAFKGAGVDVRQIICLFKWSSLDLPSDLLAVKHDDATSHTYFEALIDGKWVIIDPTWDPRISSVFHVNEWDGRTDTQVAVPATETLSPEKSLEYLDRYNAPQAVVDDMAANGEFYKAFNEYLEKVRSAK